MLAMEMRQIRVPTTERCKRQPTGLPPNHIAVRSTVRTLQEVNTSVVMTGPADSAPPAPLALLMGVSLTDVFLCLGVFPNHIAVRSIVRTLQEVNTSVVMTGPADSKPCVALFSRGVYAGVSLVWM